MTASARRNGVAKTPPKAARPAVRLAQGDEQAGARPVRDQHLMLEAAFSAPVERPYPVAVKAAIFIGAPTALWAAIIFAGAQILKAAGS
jgi:hypothetical protein